MRRPRKDNEDKQVAWLISYTELFYTWQSTVNFLGQCNELAFEMTKANNEPLTGNLDFFGHHCLCEICFESNPQGGIY